MKHKYRQRFVSRYGGTNCTLLNWNSQELTQKINKQIELIVHYWIETQREAMGSYLGTLRTNCTLLNWNNEVLLGVYLSVWGTNCTLLNWNCRCYAWHSQSFSRTNCTLLNWNMLAASCRVVIVPELIVHYWIETGMTLCS